MYLSTGRSGIGNQFSDNENGHTWQDLSGITPNGRQIKQEDKRYVRDLSGQAFWNMRKEDNPEFYDIKPEDYKCPSYYHLPRKPKPVAENIAEAVQTVEENETLCIDKKEKVSVFLTLREDNIFRKIYEKYFVR